MGKFFAKSELFFITTGEIIRLSYDKYIFPYFSRTFLPETLAPNSKKRGEKHHSLAKVNLAKISQFCQSRNFISLIPLFRENIS